MCVKVHTGSCHVWCVIALAGRSYWCGGGTEPEVGRPPPAHPPLPQPPSFLPPPPHSTTTPTLSLKFPGGWRPPGKGVTMKKNRSSNLRRAWPSSELTERPLEHNLSRSEKDIRVQKQHLPPPPPPHFSPSPPSYRAPGESDTSTSTSSTFSTQRCSELEKPQFDVGGKGHSSKWTIFSCL